MGNFDYNFNQCCLGCKYYDRGDFLYCSIKKKYFKPSTLACSEYERDGEY